MKQLRFMWRWLLLLVSAVTMLSAQTSPLVEVRMRMSVAHNGSRHSMPPAVLWLDPLRKTSTTSFPPLQRYTLLQKNRTFMPHLLVIPVGSVVQFPNADPFFHNVFSLFDGKRFDLGLYEAGSTKSVTFSREGISYIFCNIHPQMSAVVITLSTNLFDTVDSQGVFHIADVPPGDYEMHVWIEGVAQAALNKMARRVRLTSGSADLGTIEIQADQLNSASHTNLYGQSYDRDVKPPY